MGAIVSVIIALFAAAALLNRIEKIEKRIALLEKAGLIECDACHALFKRDELHEADTGQHQWIIDKRIALQCGGCHEHWIGHC